MSEISDERKDAILFTTTLLCARKLIDNLESDKPNMSEDYFIERAIRKAERILEMIDRRWPAS